MSAPARTKALPAGPVIAKSPPGAAPSLTPARAPMLQRACPCGGASHAGKCPECQKKDKNRPLQRAPDGGAEPTSMPASVPQTLRSPGHALDAPTRSFMESRFSQDFSRVRVHDDAAAARSAHDVGARAYTVGQDIVFGASRYAPHSDEGRSLLAHELAHTVQQHGLQMSPDHISLDRGPEYDHLEREAETAASVAMRGDLVNVSRASLGRLSRADEEEFGEVVPVKGKKSGKKKSRYGWHEVVPTAAFEREDGREEEFTVDPLYVPGAKGPAAQKDYEAIAGGKLETVLMFTGTGRTKTALWQKRESTENLRTRWLDKMKWTEEAANDLWKRSGGAGEFPKTKGGTTCQMDHIVELQLGGDNTNENIQPLDAGPNRESGSGLRLELEELATQIGNDRKLSNEDTTQIKMRFAAIKMVPPIEKVAPTCPPPGKANCLTIEKCAGELSVETTETGEVKIARVDYPVIAGGAERNLKVPVTFAKTKGELVPIKGDPENNAASTIVPGLLLTELSHIKNKLTPDFVTAEIDTRPETRLPLSLDPKSKDILLDVHPDERRLALSKQSKTTSLAFTYKYLSPGKITSITINEAGETDWTGKLTPGIPFLGTLDIAYKNRELSITKGLDPSQLKPPFPGVRIAEASLGLKLAPEFKPEGKLRLQFGPEAQPLAEAALEASTDGKGFVAEGRLNVFIPGVDKAEANVTYKGGGEYGAGSWTGLITIESSQIKLPYVQGGSITVQLRPGAGIDAVGRLDLAFPGENTASLELEKSKDTWLLTGRGRFRVPKVGPISPYVRYNLGTQRVVAGVKDVSFEIFGLTAKMNELTAEIAPGEPPVFYGSGGVELRKGKLSGRADLTLTRKGKFTGRGEVEYQFNENLRAKAGVELDDKERLKFAGELVTSIKLFDQFGDTKDLFSLDIQIPIPGASIGGVGLEARVGGGVKAGYSVGPGRVDPLIISADFYPLEEQSDLKAGVRGMISIPASAKLEAYIYGGVALDVFIAEVGGKIVLTGTITLAGGLFAPFSATYQQGRIDASITPEIKAALLLGLALDFTAWAKAGVGWLSVKTEKTWNLAKREIDTGLGFSLKAPISYSTATGPRLPSIDQVELKKPDITTENMKRILRELVSGSSVKEREV
jgi:hypothetical protein